MGVKFEGSVWNNRGVERLPVEIGQQHRKQASFFFVLTQAASQE